MLNQLRIFIAAKALRECAARIDQLERENAKLKKTNARYQTKLDQFHTGYAAPRAIDGHVTNEFVLREKPSYNELARLHANQRGTILLCLRAPKAEPYVPRELKLGEGDALETSEGCANA